MKISKSFHLAAAIFFLLNCIIINSQTDTSYVDKTHTSIEDSSIHTDSTETVYSKKTFLIKFDYDENRIILPAYRLKKSEIDFSDYRYAGNIISYLPFGHLNDFGSLGTPSEPVVFGFGNGNISLISDDDDISNYWNGSADLNFIQTENISAISVIPIHKAFLFGFNNNPASVLITTQDSLRARPISRIRYYQAPNEEGFVDAFFSARVLKKFAMSIRATNHAIDNFYTNSESGAWKLNLKGIYKISDSVFTNLVLDHRKLNTPLNGGVDAELLLNSTGSLNDIYDNANPVMYDNLNNELLHNSIKNTVYGRILPWGFTRISLSYREHEEVFSYGDDTSSVKRSSYYKVWRAALSQKLEMSDLYLSFDGGYEFTDNKSSSYKSNKNLQNYYASFYTSYSLAENTVLPAVFGKYSYYNEQNTSGIGADIKINFLKNVKLNLGYGSFGKSYSLIETDYLGRGNKQSFKNIFAAIELDRRRFSNSFSYFRSNVKNLPLALLNSSNEQNVLNEVVFKTSDTELEGINFNSSIEFLNILFTGNLNYYFRYETEYFDKENIFNANCGLYYVDTLFSDNLNLKTGIVFYYNNNPNHNVYDFHKMRSTYMGIENDAVNRLNLFDVNNDKFRLDFYLAGRIQDAATFYLIYENILSNKYFVVPYFPMPEGGIRIGLSWDFID